MRAEVHPAPSARIGAVRPAEVAEGVLTSILPPPPGV